MVSTLIEPRFAPSLLCARPTFGRNISGVLWIASSLASGNLPASERNNACSFFQTPVRRRVACGTHCPPTRRALAASPCRSHPCMRGPVFVRHCHALDRQCARLGPIARIRASARHTADVARASCPAFPGARAQARAPAAAPADGARPPLSLGTVRMVVRALQRAVISQISHLCGQSIHRHGRRKCLAVRARVARTRSDNRAWAFPMRARCLSNGFLPHCFRRHCNAPAQRIGVSPPIAARQCIHSRTDRLADPPCPARPACVGFQRALSNFAILLTDA